MRRKGCTLLEDAPAESRGAIRARLISFPMSWHVTQLRFYVDCGFDPRHSMQGAEMADLEEAVLSSGLSGAAALP